MTLLSRLFGRALHKPVNRELVVQERLIDRIDLMIEARCPCGAATAHLMALHTTADCPRCSRSFAIRSVEYFRAGPHQLPDMKITLGFVWKTSGSVH